MGSEPPGVVLWTGACLVAKRLQTLGAAREPFRGLCPVGARRGRGGSQGRVVEGSPPAGLAQRAALRAQALVAGATCPAASWECAAALRPARILITRGRGAAGEGARMRCGGGSHGGPGRGGQQGREQGGGKARGQITAQLGLQTHPWGEAQSSLAGPTAERLCFPSPSALHHPSVSQALSLGLGFRLSVKPWTLLCTWGGGMQWVEGGSERPMRGQDPVSLKTFIMCTGHYFQSLFINTNLLLSPLDNSTSYSPSP